MHQTVCTSLVLNILAFTLLFTIFKYSVTRCYMKGLLCNIVRVPVNSGAISLNGISFRDVIFARRSLKARTEENDTRPLAFCPTRCIVEKKKKRKETNVLTITNCFFYPTNDLTHGCRVSVLSSKARLFFFTRVGHPRAPSKIISFIRSVRLSFPD